MEYGILIIIGVVILSLYLKHKERQYYLYSGIENVDKMTGEQFEYFLKVHFEKEGYNAKMTRKSHDFGGDLILTKGKEKIIIQAKRYKSSVGIKAVQEVIGAIGYYEGTKGMVICNSYFTKSAKELALKNNIELWDRRKLIQTFNIESTYKVMSYNSSEYKGTTINKPLKDEEICPKCGNKLVERNGKNGKFIGCTGFPNCRYTRNI